MRRRRVRRPAKQRRQQNKNKLELISKQLESYERTIKNVSRRQNLSADILSFSTSSLRPKDTFTNKRFNQRLPQPKLDNTQMTIIADINSLMKGEISEKLNSLKSSLVQPPKFIFVNASTNPPELPLLNNTKSERQLISRSSFLLQQKTKICIYEGVPYRVGQRVPTIEPCLECICYERTIICGLRVCRKSSLLKGPPLEGCRVEEVPGQCCPDITCRSGGKRFAATVCCCVCLLSETNQKKNHTWPSNCPCI